MNKRLVLDEVKYKSFMKENAAWQNTIKAQVNEIPLMLASNVHTADQAKENGYDAVLYKQLVLQHSAMQKLNEDIDVQQQRLAKDCTVKNEYDIDAYCNQDILRERIKAIEKTYIDLKCNFLNHMMMLS